MRSENWPRPGYLKSYIHPQDFADLSLCPEAAELISLLDVRGSSSEEICRIAQSLKRSHPALTRLVDAIAMSRTQILQKGRGREKRQLCLAQECTRA